MVDGRNISGTIYVIKEVKKLLRHYKIPYRKFNKWFIGQTYMVLDNGKIGYFTWDVQRFIKMEVDNVPTYWD